jgi:hypothetical protein
MIFNVNLLVKDINFLVLPLLRYFETLTNYVDVNPPPLLTSPRSTTQPMFAKFDICNISNIAFTKINYIAIVSSLENPIDVTCN